MKKITSILILIFIAFISFSCKNGEIKELKNQITFLENTLSELKDSISKSKKDKIFRSNIIIQAHKESFKINEKTKVKFVFNYIENIPKYDVYEILNENNRKLILENLTVNEFEYEYSPTKEGWNPIKLMAVFKFENEKIEIPVLSSIKGTK